MPNTHVEEGDSCPRCTGTNSRMEFQPNGDCACHINPPCAACEGNRLVCCSCGYVHIEGDIDESDELEAYPHDPGLVIPPVNDFYGRYWKQPCRDRIELDATHALMSQKDFDLLEDYSSSCPSGVYSGKMWKMFGWGEWWLRWFGPLSSPHSVWTHQRRILILENPGTEGD